MIKPPNSQPIHWCLSLEISVRKQTRARIAKSFQNPLIFFQHFMDFPRNTERSRVCADGVVVHSVCDLSKFKLRKVLNLWAILVDGISMPSSQNK